MTYRNDWATASNLARAGYLLLIGLCIYTHEGDTP